MMKVSYAVLELYKLQRLSLINPQEIVPHPEGELSEIDTSMFLSRWKSRRIALMRTDHESVVGFMSGVTSGAWSFSP